MMKKIVVALAMAAGLLAPVAVTTAQASEVPGRPGRYELSMISISETICFSNYSVPFEGNSAINSSFNPDLHVVENKNFTIVTCSGVDTSGVYEANAEVGYTDNCLYDGMTGSGTVTRANNGDTTTGGQNVTFRCKFAK